MRTVQVWEVILAADGLCFVEEHRAVPPMAQASAEVTAIKAAEARGAKSVRCTFSRFLRDETEPSE